MLIIFNVEPNIGDNIGNGIIQRWLRFRINELFLVSIHYPLLLSMVALLVPLGTYILLLLIFFHPFDFIIPNLLNYRSFKIAPMITNCPDKVVLIKLVTNNTVVVPHFA